MVRALSIGTSNSPLTCYLLTYNIAGKALLVSQLRAIMGYSREEREIDIFAFGFQECPKKWVRGKQSKYRRTLNRQLSLCLSPYKMIKDCSIGVIHMAIFVRRELVDSVTDKEAVAKSVSHVSRGYRTKGAVAIAFRLNSHPLLFINCHFRFGRKFEFRRQDYRQVVHSLRFAQYPSRTSERGTLDPFASFECVFWQGDFNTRFVNDRCARYVIDRARCASISDITTPQITRLERLDQLYLELQKTKRKSFDQFVEPNIHFPPTYKFVIDSCMYYWVKRTPAYTDRILYRKTNSVNVSCVQYKAVTDLRVSDHLPVFGVFEVIFQ